VAGKAGWHGGSQESGARSCEEEIHGIPINQSERIASSRLYHDGWSGR
jgi:hypothetical protein